MPPQLVNRPLLVHSALANTQVTATPASAQTLKAVDLGAASFVATPVATTVAQPVKAQTTMDLHPAVLNARLMTFQPLAVSQSVATVRPETIHWIDPNVARQISDLGNEDTGKPRSAFAPPVLVSPAAAPDADTLLEEPADPAQKHYLPHYGIASLQTGSGPVKWVSLEPSADAGGGWRLIVHLTPLPAPAVPAGSTLTPLGTVPTRYLLSATDPATNVVQTWEFGEASEQDGVLLLVLTLTGADAFAGRDRVHRAMTDAAAKAKLVVRRSLELAVPVPPPLPPRRLYYAAPATMATTATVSRVDPAMIIRFPPYGGGVTEPLYRQETIAIDTTVDFTFDPVYDANVFAQAPGAPGGHAGFNHLTAVWPDGGRPYTYYQEQDQPEIFHFLPDRFEITRRPGSPHLPSLAVDVSGDSIDQALFTLSYVAAPVWDPARIAAAAEALKSHAGGRTPVFVQIEPADPKLRLKLPTDAGPAFVDQTAARVSLIAGISGSVSLPLEPFQRVFNAFFDEVGDLLTGEVAVTIEGEETAIPFNARARSFVGEIFDHEEAADAGSGGLRVMLRNAVESPIQVTSLPVTLRQGQQTVPARLASADPPLPARLAPATDATPAGALTLIVTPATPGSAPLDDTWDAVFDLGGVQVLSDPAAVWDAVLSRGVAGTSTRTVTVKVPAATFGPPAAVLAVQVQFETGGTASFEPPASPPAGAFLDKAVEIAVPIRDFVLGLPGAGSYRYRVRTVSAAGIQTGDWQTDSTDDLFVVVTPG